MTSYEWDTTFGTLLKETDKTGLVTTYSYYPSTGDGSNCPADPNGFGTHLKERIKYPAPDLPSVSPRHRTYTYGAQPSVNDPGVYYLAVETETEADDNGTAYHVRGHSYYDDVSDPFTAGRKKQVVVTCITPETSTSLDTTFASAYTQDATSARVATTTTKTGFDGTTSSHTKTSSYLSGLRYSMTEVTTAGSPLTVDFAYDKLHRLVSATMCAGTGFEACRQYVYTNATDTARQQKLTLEVSGAQSRDSFDGHGNLIQSEVLDADAMVGSDTTAFYVTGEYVYDQLSRKVSQTSYDYLKGDAADAPSISSCATYAYDAWGELVSTRYGSGYESIQQVDPVAMTVFTAITVDGVQEQQELSQYDLFQNTVTQTSFEADGITPYAQTTWTYDGFGKEIGETDPLKNETQTSYDFFNREIETVCADGSRERIGYAPHTSRRLTTSLTCLGNGDDGDGTPMGARHSMD